MNDTPRTDAGLEYDDTTVDDVKDFARSLERELNRACEMFRKLNIHALNLADRIKRLEAAGDELMYDNDDMANINRWNKAKEAKP